MSLCGSPRRRIFRERNWREAEHRGQLHIFPNELRDAVPTSLCEKLRFDECVASGHRVLYDCQDCIDAAQAVLDAEQPPLFS